MRNKTRKFKEGIIARGLHRHPLVVPVVTFIGLCFLTMVGFVILGSQDIDSGVSHVVQLSADNKKQTVPTRASTVGDFLTRAQITLHEGDVVEPAVSVPIDNDDFRINVYRAKPVTIIDGDERIQALSAATTPRSIAEQVGIEVYPEDEINEVAPTNILRDQVIGTQLVIDRSIPIHLNLYGTQVDIRSRANNIDELLKDKNISLSGGDSVSPKGSTPLKANMQVFITRHGTKIKTVEETVPYKTEYIEDNNLSFGTTAVRQKGNNGRKLVTYQIQIKNGKEVSRRVIQQVQAKKPINEVVARGKAFNKNTDKAEVMARAGINVDRDYPYVDYIVERESHWNPLAQNFSSGAYGLCQALPGSKMASAGSDWQSNPVTQLKWCNGYAQQYGGWAGAYDFWLSHGWW